MKCCCTYVYLKLCRLPIFLIIQVVLGIFFPNNVQQAYLLNKNYFRSLDIIAKLTRILLWSLFVSCFIFGHVYILYCIVFSNKGLKDHQNWFQGKCFVFRPLTDLLGNVITKYHYRLFLCKSLNGISLAAKYPGLKINCNSYWTICKSRIHDQKWKSTAILHRSCPLFISPSLIQHEETGFKRSF